MAGHVARNNKAQPSPSLENAKQDPSKAPAIVLPGIYFSIPDAFLYNIHDKDESAMEANGKGPLN